MDWIYAFGVEPEPMQAWQWLYLFNLVGVMSLLLVGLLLSDLRKQVFAKALEELPLWAGAPLALITLWGFVYAFPPTGYTIASFSCALMAQMGAPVSAVIISVAMTVGAWVLMVACVNHGFRLGRT